MSRGSTMRRRAERSAGLPVGYKEKFKYAMLGLVKIALGDEDPKKTAINTLSILGLKPRPEAASAAKTE